MSIAATMGEHMTAYSVLINAERRLSAVVGVMDPTLLDRPTPCSAWDVRALLSHTLAGIEAFASSVDGKPGPTQEEMFGGVDLLGNDPVAAIQRATARSQAAWRDLADPQVVVSTILGPLPAGQAMAISAFATIVHSWDLAIATGREVTELPGHLLEPARTVADQIVPGLRAGEGHSLFQPELPPPPDATPTQRLMAFLGRQSATRDIL